MVIGTVLIHSLSWGKEKMSAKSLDQEGRGELTRYATRMA